MKLFDVIKIMGYDNRLFYNDDVNELLKTELGWENSLVAMSIYRIQRHLLKKYENDDARQLSHILMTIQRTFCGCEIYPDAEIGDNFQLAHGGGIVVGGGSVIGNNVMVFPGVVVGDLGSGGGCPTIGDNVRIYSNSTISGPVNIGNGAIIGTNSFVNRDVEPGKTVAGNPAREI